MRYRGNIDGTNDDIYVYFHSCEEIVRSYYATFWSARLLTLHAGGRIKIRDKDHSATQLLNARLPRLSLKLLKLIVEIRLC